MPTIILTTIFILFATTSMAGDLGESINRIMRLNLERDIAAANIELRREQLRQEQLRQEQASSDIQLRREQLGLDRQRGSFPIGTLPTWSPSTGFSGTTQRLGDTDYSTFSNGTSCTSQHIGDQTYTSCY